ALHISFFDPFRQPDLVDSFAQARVTAISMELIPRITVAQKMDALSSQASLAGYVAVILAAERINRVFPMMMTPAGTLAAVRVLVIGAGVAGLQAIATARRLGARVEAYDVRPEVEEQVKSLGARFLKIDLGQVGSTPDGYAKQLTEEQLQRQREAMKRFCSHADVLITTAQVFGRRAPLIVTEEMLLAMRPGSIVVDLAVESGGNVEGIRPGSEVEKNGVLLLGLRNLPGRVPYHASQVYGSNLSAMLGHLYDREKGHLRIDLQDQITGRCVVTHGGQVVNPLLKEG
ncbi:MAG TPA: NAD(P) transhydrogenase subunit alpha, partial [Lentisphaerae bacterium]|nr:NAD(P) transhydrogenase subunit alpha [Lentisphaerota bacterium]